VNSNFEKKFLTMTSVVRSDLSIAKQRYCEALDRTAQSYREFIESNICTSEDEFEEQIYETVHHMSESTRDCLFEFPLCFFEESEIYTQIIDAHINLINNEEIPDIDPTLNLEEI